MFLSVLAFFFILTATPNHAYYPMSVSPKQI